MRNLTLQTQCGNHSTELSNIFIDSYMPRANGEFVKLYIYLLRCMSDSRTGISVAMLADTFNETEADVMRALKYWSKVGAISLSYNSDGSDDSSLSGITFCDLNSADDYTDTECTTAAEPKLTPVNVTSNAPADIDATYTPAKVSSMQSDDDFRQTLFVVGTYLGGILSSSEMSSVAYFYDKLKFSTDLIEYLVEYCVGKGKKNMRYIEKVAINWAESGITTVDEAREHVAGYNDAAYSVLNAFGITGRTAGKVELEYINRWTDTYCFNADIIVEACNRTLRATHQPSFEYADSILKKWQAANVTTTEDIKRIDVEFERNQQSRFVKRSNSYANGSATDKSTNRFNNFHQRNTDIESLESALLSNNG